MVNNNKGKIIQHISSNMRLLKSYLLKLWQEACTPPTNKGILKTAYEGAPSVIKRVLAGKTLLGLIRRDVMRMVRSHRVYLKVFGYIKQHIVKLAYVSVCILSWAALYPKGWLLLVAYVVVGCVTIHHVSSHMKAGKENLVYMNLMLFYLNGMCICVFFFDYIHKLL